MNEKNIPNEVLNKALDVACETGNEVIVRFLVEAGANSIKTDDAEINRGIGGMSQDTIKEIVKRRLIPIDKSGEILRIAIKNGYQDIIDILLTNGYDFESEFHEVLCCAIENKNVQLIKKLLDVKKEKKISSLCITKAISSDNSEIVQLIIEAGKDEIKDSNNAIIEAAMNNNLEAFKLIINAGSKMSFLALKFAVKCGNIEMLKIGMKIFKLTTSYRNELIKNAAMFGYIDIVKLLIDGCDDRNAYIGALAFAAEYGYENILELMLKLGANVNEMKGWAIVNASKNGHTQIVKKLIQAGADVNIRCNVAIIYAAENGFVEIVGMLLEAGANGNDAMRMAIINGKRDVVKFLIKKGIDVIDKSCEYKILAMYNANSPDIVFYIIEEEIKAGIYNDDSIIWAAKLENYKLLKKLIG